MARRKQQSPTASRKKGHSHSTSTKRSKKADRIRADAKDAFKKRYAAKFTKMYADEIQTIIETIESNKESAQNLQEEIEKLATNPNARKKTRGAAAVAEKKQALLILNENEQTLAKLYAEIEKQAASKAEDKTAAMEIDSEAADASSSDEDEEMNDSDSSSSDNSDESTSSETDEGSNAKGKSKTKGTKEKGKKAKEEAQLTSGKFLINIYPHHMATAKARAYGRMAGNGMMSA